MDRNVFGLSSLGEILADKELSTVSWLVDGILQANAPVLIHAPSKCCKTTLACDLAIACATGGTWLGHQAMTTNVAVVSIEDGLPGLTQTVRLLCASRSVDLPRDRMHIGSQIDDITNQSVMSALAEFIAEKQIGLAIFDPAYLILGDYQHAQMADAGGRLYKLSEVCRAAGATCVVLHHSKSTGSGLNAAAGAGFAQWPSSWVSISRVGRYTLDGKHRLKLEYGGRIGQQGSVSVSIDEGLANGKVSKCDIRVSPIQSQTWLFDTRAEQPKRKRLTPEAVLSALVRTPVSISAIQAKVGGSKATIQKHLETLIECDKAKAVGGEYQLSG